VPQGTRDRLKMGLAAAVAVVAAALIATAPAVPAPGDTANLRVVKSDSPDPVQTGSTLTYTIEVRNLGPEGATEVTVTDKLPAQVDFVSANAAGGTCTQNGRNVTCELGALAADAQPATVTIRVRPRSAGAINNVVSVDSVENDPVAANNADAEATRVVAPPEPTAAACRGVTATIKGNASDNTLVGTPGPDVIAAFAGNDVIRSLAGRDLICAGRDIDLVNGGTASDRVFGGSQRDRLLGRGGPDALRGGAGPDTLKGNIGSDKLRGGQGFDRCFGGPGFDTERACEV
jgi:uncharacterized repeat protein (TIGR01451 family)